MFTLMKGRYTSTKKLNLPILIILKTKKNEALSVYHHRTF